MNFLRMNECTRPPNQKLLLADEVWLIVARMHQRDPNRESFAAAEIVADVRNANLCGQFRAGVAPSARSSSPDRQYGTESCWLPYAFQTAQWRTASLSTRRSRTSGSKGKDDAGSRPIAG